MMETEMLNGYEVVVGECSKCAESRVLINYMGEKFCQTCIRNDEHLSAMIGWHR